MILNPPDSNDMFAANLEKLYVPADLRNLAPSPVLPGSAQRLWWQIAAGIPSVLGLNRLRDPGRIG